jgi:hypothetical protein
MYPTFLMPNQLQQATSASSVIMQNPEATHHENIAAYLHPELQAQHNQVLKHH